MAKKPELKADLFAKTDTKEATQEKDIIEAKSAGLKKSEWIEFEQIAEDMGVTSHAVRAYALRYFLKQYQAGKIKPKTKTVTVLE